MNREEETNEARVIAARSEAVAHKVYDVLAAETSNPMAGMIVLAFAAALLIKTQAIDTSEASTNEMVDDLAGLTKSVLKFSILIPPSRPTSEKASS